MKFWRDTWALTARSMLHVCRSPDTIITVAVMPIAMMLLFVFVFGGAIGAGSQIGDAAISPVDQGAGQRAGSYVDYLLPGILLIAVATGISYTAVRVFTDGQQGLLTRLHSLPVSRSAVLWAHVVTSIVSTSLSLLLIVFVAVLIGFRPSAGPVQWMAIVAVLGLFTFALTWLAVIPGLLAKSIDGASAFAYPLIFLPFISSAFVPTSTMPGPVRWFAEHQPVTAVVNALRSLLSGDSAGSDLWVGLGWCVGVGLLAYGLAARTYARTS